MEPSYTVGGQVNWYSHLENHLPPKKKCKKAKWFSEEALQIAEKRREAKGKGEKERYTHPNEEFQRIAKRDKKAFLRDQCKEIKENNRMGKTRDLFKKIRGITDYSIIGLNRSDRPIIYLVYWNLRHE